MIYVFLNLNPSHDVNTLKAGSSASNSETPLLFCVY